MGVPEGLRVNSETLTLEYWTGWARPPELLRSKDGDQGVLLDEPQKRLEGQDGLDILGRKEAARPVKSAFSAPRPEDAVGSAVLPRGGGEAGVDRRGLFKIRNPCLLSGGFCDAGTLLEGTGSGILTPEAAAGAGRQESGESGCDFSRRWVFWKELTQIWGDLG